MVDLRNGYLPQRSIPGPTAHRLVHFRRAGLILGVAMLLLGPAVTATAMQPDGCGAGSCRDCHSLSKDEASGLLKEIPVEVLDVDFSEVPGLWTVGVRNRQGQQGHVYVDFSKQYLISGKIVKLTEAGGAVSGGSAAPEPIDPALIPLDDALVLGARDARHKIIVFDDPACKFCSKLHPEMKKLVAERPDVAFFIKLFPLNPPSAEKAKAIVCARSLELLESSLAGIEIPPADCETDQIEQNLAVGRSIGVRATPTLVMPDGRVLPGYKTAEQLADLLEQSSE